MNLSALCSLSGALIFAGIPGIVFWAYFAGIAILAIWVFASGKDVLRARGTEKIVAFGPLFFALPMAVFASQHFTEAAGVATLVPKWMPWHLFWVYFVGTAIIVASISMVARVQARLAGIGLGAMFIVFEAMLHIPAIMRHPKNVIAWAIALRDLAFGGGAFALAGAFAGAEKRNSAGANICVTLARVFIAVPAIFFGVEHFLHPEFMPSIDFDRSWPTWLPAHAFWSYFAGTVFVIAGALLLVNWKTRVAAKWLGVAVLLLILGVYLPILIAKPLDLDNGLNFLVSTLAFGGAALLLARAVSGGGRIRE